MRFVAVACCAALLLARPGAAGELEPPTPILAGGKPIDVEHSGHAAPCVGDFDGDGDRDLLVGEYYKGRLRIYRNGGTNDSPRLDGYDLFQDGEPAGCVWTS